MFTKAVGIITVSIGLSSCFQLPLSSSGKLDQSTTLGVTAAAVSTNVGTTKAIATIDPDSKTSTQLTAPRVEGLSGASVIIPPGSLGIAADIVVEQAADFGETSLTTEMGLAADIQVSSASPGMIIRPTENVDLKKPLSLAMPLPSSFGFRLADAGSKYAIFYKYFDPTEQRLVTGFKVVDGVTVKLAFDDKSGHDVIQFEGYFGAYWATTLSREVKPSEVPPAKPAEAPIVNKANVSVIETKGIVKETEIVKTQAIPELVWTKPSIKFLAATRSVSVSIPVPAGRTVNGCKIDLYENPTKPDGLSLEAPLGTNIEYAVVRTTEHSLVGRFRCFDDQGRTSVTPWSEAIVVPAVVVASTVESVIDGTCANPQVPLEGRKYGAPSSENMPLPAVGNCRYAGNFMMDEVDSFYIARVDSTMVCGLPTHNLVEGVQKLKCVKANGANIGGDFLSLARGNYSYEIDFSKSALEPSMTIKRLPCDMPAMHILFQDSYSSSNPTFPALSNDNRMTHIGGCEFVYDTATAPTTTTDGKVTFVSADNTKYCGDIDFTTYWGSVYSKEGLHDLNNACSNAPRYFKMPTFASGVTAYHFSVKLGVSAKERGETLDSVVRLERESNCPKRLYLYSTEMGTIPTRGLNDSDRKDACSYEWYYAADKPIADLEFKVGDEMKTKLCGSANPAASDSPTLSCAGNAYPIVQSTLNAGRVYKVTASGDGNTGSITQVQISEVSGYERNCAGGLYSSLSIANGFFNEASKAFVETRECVFERMWKPTVANEGFYVHSGKTMKFCGSDGSDDRQLTVGESNSTFWCRGNIDEAAQVSAIHPLNAVPNVEYRVFADMRFPHQVRMKVVPNNPSSCADDVYINSNGSSIPGSTKMTLIGNCNYVADFTIPANANASFPYILNIGGTNCGYNNYSPNATDVDRSAAPNCSTSEPYTLNNATPGTSYRFSLKREPNSTNAVLTLQNITRDFSNFLFSGNAGTALSKPGFTSSILQPNNFSYDSYDWLVNGQNNFLLERYLSGSNTHCQLASSSALPANGTPVDMLCNRGGSVYASARVFQNNWVNGNSYRVTIGGSPIYEGPYRLTVTQNVLRSIASLNMFKGPTAVGMSASGTLNTTGDTTARPHALIGSATWNDGSNLWLFGGYSNSAFYRGELWMFDGTNWVLKHGDHTAASPRTESGVRPGARRGAATWKDGSRLYLFGGYGIGSVSSSPAEGYLNDLWYWETAGGGWTQVSGPVEPNMAGNYGALNAADPSYRPGARVGATVWKNASNEILLFGGQSNGVRVNDMWKWVSGTGWSWIGGTPDAQDGNASIPSPRAYASSWFVANALFLYGGTTDSGNSSAEMWVYSGSTWTKRKGNDASDVGRIIVQARVFNTLNTPGRTVNNAQSVSHSWLPGAMVLYQDGILWEYDRFTDQWAALLQDGQEYNLGTNMPYPNYASTPGTPSTMNTMGMRQGASVWTFGNQMYLFGGNTTDGYRSDLWEISLPSNALI